MVSNKDEEFVIFAEGFGLADVITIPQVDFTRTYTNHIMEILEVLGVEAARSQIIHQIQYTIGNYAIKVDIRHINILADVMTSKGSVHGITRYGIANMRDSTLMLASFEETAEILYNAAYFSKVDKVAGVSEKIILVKSFLIKGGYDEIRDWVF